MVEKRTTIGNRASSDGIEQKAAAIVDTSDLHENFEDQLMALCDAFEEGGPQEQKEINARFREIILDPATDEYDRQNLLFEGISLVAESAERDAFIGAFFEFAENSDYPVRTRDRLFCTIMLSLPAKDDYYVRAAKGRKLLQEERPTRENPKTGQADSTLGLK